MRFHFCLPGHAKIHTFIRNLSKSYYCISQHKIFCILVYCLWIIFIEASTVEYVNNPPKLLLLVRGVWSGQSFEMSAFYKQWYNVILMSIWGVIEPSYYGASSFKFSDDGEPRSSRQTLSIFERRNHEYLKGEIMSILPNTLMWFFKNVL